MVTWWLGAGAALIVIAALIVPIRFGLRVHASPDGLHVHAVYDLGGPFKGAVTIPDLRAFQRPGTVAKNGGATGQGGRGPAGRGLSAWEGRRWALVVVVLRIAMALLRKVDRFEWRTRIGTGDAASTSWFAGLRRAVKSSALAAIARGVTWLSQPRVEVVPDYSGVSFALDATCIFRFRCGEIIVAAVRYVLRRG